MEGLSSDSTHPETCVNIHTHICCIQSLPNYTHHPLKCTLESTQTAQARTHRHSLFCPFTMERSILRLGPTCVRGLPLNPNTRDPTWDPCRSKSKMLTFPWGQGWFLFDCHWVSVYVNPGPVCPQVLSFVDFCTVKALGSCMLTSETSSLTLLYSLL